MERPPPVLGRVLSVPASLAAHAASASASKRGERVNGRTESLQVLEFADGKVSLVAVRAFHGGPLVGHELQEIRRHMPNVETRVAAIFRQDAPIVPEGRTVIEAGDEVFFIAATENIRGVMRELRRMDKPIRRIMIGGGGNIG